jgi:2,4-dienoyl-CoA reductase-like NADH-dependent reductase (Old Yellow Enzyme family)
MPAAETPALPRLLSPLRLAGFELRNRIVSTAHSTGLSGGTRLGDRAIAYYAARARGGAVESARIVAPSVIDTELGSEIPHVLEVDEIGEIVTAFAAAAVRVRDGGLDRVELHGGHGNLIQQFLSPLTNQRRDDYGGSPEHRRRFALEVARAVRAAVGPDFVVGLRLSAEEDHPGAPPSPIHAISRRQSSRPAT